MPSFQPDAITSDLRHFVEAAPLAMAVLDTEMRYLAASACWREEYGLADTALEGRSHYDVFPDLPTRWRDVHRRCLAGAVEESHEDVFVRSDGRQQWLRWRAWPWRRADGRVGGLVLCTEDLTAAKAATDAARTANDHLAALTLAAPVGLAHVDRDGRVLELNQRFAEIVGVSAERAMGHGWMQGIHADDLEGVRRSIGDAMASGRPGSVEFRSVRADGRTVWVLAHGIPQKDAAGTVIGGVGTLTDVTAAKEADAERLASLSRMRGVVAAAAGVWEWDARTNRITSDDRDRALQGFLSGEVATLERWLSKIHADDRRVLVERLEDLDRPAGGDRWDAEFRVVHPDGAVRWVHAVGRAERDRDGRLTHLTGLSFDVTERKVAAERASAVEKRLKQFVATTADVLYSMTVQGQELGVIDFLAPAAERIYGRPSQAFYDNPRLPLEVVHPADRPKVDRAFEALVTTGRFDEVYRIIRPDGSVRWLHDRAHVVRQESGDVVRSTASPAM